MIAAAVTPDGSTTPTAFLPREPSEIETGAALASVMTQTGRDAVVICISKDPNAKLTVVLVDGTGGGAELVAKVATTPLADTVVEREFATLESLHREFDHPMMAVVPRPLGLLDAGGRVALLMSARPGVPMLTTYQRGRHTAQPSSVEADFRAAHNWLVGFQGVSAGSTLDSGRLGDELALERLARRYPDSDASERIEPQLRRLARSRRGTAAHGDLWAGNLLLAGGAVSGVVDWEAGERWGDPLSDVVRFALSYALYLDRKTPSGRRVAGHRQLRCGDWGAGIRYAVQAEGWFPRLFRQFLSANLERLGLPGSAWPQLCLAGLVDVAVSADHADFGRRHLDLAVELALHVDAGDRGRSKR